MEMRHDQVPVSLHEVLVEQNVERDAALALQAQAVEDREFEQQIQRAMMLSLQEVAAKSHAAADFSVCCQLQGLLDKWLVACL